MKTIISGAVAAIAIVACLSLNVQAVPVNHSATVAAADTGKMAKMKMDKMSKMKKDSMKMSKKMMKKKMAKDTGKMGKS
jgi:hypothetical protein